MKHKLIILAGIAALALVFSIFLIGCSSLPGLIGANYVPDGTYTFSPRLRASRDGVDANAYLSKIVASGGNVSVYISDVLQGVGNFGGIAGNWQRAILQDLDNPSKSYNSASDTIDRESQLVVVTYSGISARRFSITTSQGHIFEVTLGEPDAQ